MFVNVSRQIVHLQYFMSGAQTTFLTFIFIGILLGESLYSWIVGLCLERKILLFVCWLAWKLRIHAHLISWLDAPGRVPNVWMTQIVMHLISHENSNFLSYLKMATDIEHNHDFFFFCLAFLLSWQPFQVDCTFGV